MLGPARFDMDDAALREKLGIYAGCGRNNGYLDFQMDAESEWIAGGESGAATTKIFTGSVLLESRTRQIHATNHNWEVHRDSAFPSALEGWGRSAGSGHPLPPQITVWAKKASTRFRISTVVRDECTFLRSSAPFRTPCVK